MTSPDRGVAVHEPVQEQAFDGRELLRLRDDALTEINSAALSQFGDTCEQSREPASLLIDVDHFKLHHDTPGHLRGDECRRLTPRAVCESG
jgi:GGDEF domain-containing protein